jgi:UDP-N-acetyl-D-glucosamine dehydrogenase
VKIHGTPHALDSDCMWGALRERLSGRSAVIGVMGLGYVGLPLALAFARKFSVVGFDVRPELVQALRRGEARAQGISRDDLIGALDTRFVPTSDFDRLRECDIIIIAVGTPLTHGKEPDLSQLESAAREVAKRLHPGQFVVLESTTYPGTTEEVVVPILESGGLRAGVDFGVAYSPERIDPGNRTFALEEIPKLVGGIDVETTALAREIYAEVIREVVPVSHARIAEAAKIIENLFRAVNIALVNEIALIMERLDIDVWEALKAASTKPFGYMPFLPGPGIGGHCIPVDPYYLSYRARKAGYMPRFIELSGDVNEYMQFHVVELMRRGLKEAGKKTTEATVAVLGVSFKKNVADTRESPAARVVDECLRERMDVRVYDPHALSLTTVSGTKICELDVESALSGADAAVLLVDHDEFRGLDFDAVTRLMNPRPVWVDARGFLEMAPTGSIAFGIGRPGGRIPAHHNDAPTSVDLGSPGVAETK